MYDKVQGRYRIDLVIGVACQCAEYHRNTHLSPPVSYSHSNFMGLHVSDSIKPEVRVTGYWGEIVHHFYLRWLESWRDSSDGVDDQEALPNVYILSASYESSRLMCFPPLIVRCGMTLMFEELVVLMISYSTYCTCTVYLGRISQFTLTCIYWVPAYNTEFIMQLTQRPLWNKMIRKRVLKENKILFGLVWRVQYLWT